MQILGGGNGKKFVREKLVGGKRKFSDENKHFTAVDEQKNAKFSKLGGINFPNICASV